MRGINEIHDLSAMLHSHAEDRGEVAALIFEGRHTSFRELDRRADAVAAALAGAGVLPGERIAYLARNSDRYFEILFGAARAGVVLTPVNERLAPPEIQHILADSGSRMLFAAADLAVAATNMRPTLPALSHIITIDDDAYEQWRDGHAACAPRHDVAAQDIVLQLYTSGTTGRPKGVMLSHSNLLRAKAFAAHSDMSWDRWDEQDIALVATPLAHVGATGWALWALYYGATALILREFDAEEVLNAIDKERVTKLFLVPAALRIVVRHPKAARTDFSGLRFVMYGASPMPPALLIECIDVFKCGFVQHYGMTETSGTVVFLPPEDHGADGPHMLATGRPMPGMEIAIRDSEGRLVASGAIGEILVRGPAVMAGYWRMPEATSDAFADDGWLRTGDCGYLDEDGYLFIADRLKDMIISGGENIYPTEVEAVVSAHPGIADVAVIGVPDERWGEAVKAIVVPHDPGSFSSDEVREWCRGRLAAFKIPKSFDMAEVIPRNTSGKINRLALREPFWAGQVRRVN